MTVSPRRRALLQCVAEGRVSTRLEGGRAVVRADGLHTSSRELTRLQGLGLVTVVPPGTWALTSAGETALRCAPVGMPKA